MLGSSPSRNSVTLPKQLPGGATWRTMLVVPMVPGCSENADTLEPCSLRHVRCVVLRRTGAQHGADSILSAAHQAPQQLARDASGNSVISHPAPHLEEPGYGRALLNSGQHTFFIMPGHPRASSLAKRMLHAFDCAYAPKAMYLRRA